MSENFLQHAEHYIRILTASQPQQQPRREEREYDADATESHEPNRGDGRREPAVADSLAVMDGDVEAPAPESFESAATLPRRRASQTAGSEDAEGGEEPRRRRGRQSRRAPREDAAPAAETAAPSVDRAPTPELVGDQLEAPLDVAPTRADIAEEAEPTLPLEPSDETPPPPKRRAARRPRATKSGGPATEPAWTPEDTWKPDDTWKPEDAWRDDDDTVRAAG